MRCPKCQQELVIQPTISDDYKKAYCYGQAMKATPRGNKSVACGFRGVIHNGDLMEFKDND